MIGRLAFTFFMAYVLSQQVVPQKTPQKVPLDILSNLKTIDTLNKAIQKKIQMYCESNDDKQKQKILGSIYMLRNTANFKSKENQRILKRSKFKGQQKLVKEKGHNYLNVTVKTLSGFSLNFTVDDCETFLQFRQRIGPYIGVQPGQIERFIFRGRTVDLQKTMKENNVQDGATIHVDWQIYFEIDEKIQCQQSPSNQKP